MKPKRELRAGFLEHRPGARVNVTTLGTSVGATAFDLGHLADNTAVRAAIEVLIAPPIDFREARIVVGKLRLELLEGELGGHFSFPNLGKLSMTQILPLGLLAVKGYMPGR